MGLYIESDNKVLFCESNASLIKVGRGKVINLDNYENIVNEDRERIICLVDNGYFLALAVGTDKREVERFNDENDDRLKRFYRCSLEVIRQVCNYDEYMMEDYK